MARSNGNQDRTGSQPARPQHAGEPIDHGLPWHNGAGQQPGQAYDQQAAGQLPWPQQYQQPQNAPALQQYQGQQGYAPAGYAPPNYPQTQAYAPPPDAHHGHYFPQGAQQQLGVDYGQQPHAGQAYAAAPAAYQDPASQLRGSYAGQAEAHAYTAPPTQAGYPSQAYAPQQGYDPRGFDLGAYGNPATGYPDPVTGRTLPPTGAQQVPFGQAPNATSKQPLNPSQAAAHGEHDDEEYEDEEDEEEAPRKRFGILKVLGVLTVAIALGGGAAYGVKKFGGGLLTASTKPVTVKADATPSKARPTTAAADKAAERLGGDQLPPVVPAGNGLQANNSAPGEARKVQTIAIPAATTSPLRPTMSIPGVTVEGAMAAAPPSAAQPAALPPVTRAPEGRAVAPPPVVAQPQRAPVAPKVIAAVEEAAAPKAAPPARIPVAQAPRLTKGNDAYSPASGVGAATVAAATTAPASAPAKAGNGFIAVLASQGSAIDARKTLDDLQGKYSEAIGGKPTDVTEFANPRDGKTYYRAVVGPPGSREAAASVCEKIKTAGHKDCFAAPY